jgi:phage-related minor tail protein
MSGIGGIAAPKKDIRIVKDDEILQKQKEFYAKEVAISQAKMGRLQIENQLAFAQENERKIALEYYDLQQKIILLRTEKKMTDQDIAKYAEVEKQRIMSMEKVLEDQRTFEYGWKKAFASYAENAANSAKMAEQSFVALQQNLEDTLTQFFETGKLNFRGFITSILHEMARLQAQKAASSILGLFGGGSGGGIGGFISSLFSSGASPAFGSTAFWGGKAGGGDINGPSMVGENGPELFIPKSAGTIVPNNRVNSLMGNQPQVVYNGPYIANMSAIDTQSGLQFLAKNKQGVWAANQSAQRSLPQSR